MSAGLRFLSARAERGFFNFHVYTDHLEGWGNKWSDTEGPGSGLRSLSGRVSIRGRHC